MGERVSVLCTVDDLATPGWVTRRDIPPDERLRRGGKMLGALWGVGVLSVFVPILHFVLPPIFFLLGLTFGFLVWRTKSEILEGEISCPNCKKVMRLQRLDEDWPFEKRCEGCSFTLRIKKA